MTNEPKAGGSLDPEMLAAYIDKRLPPDERAVVEAKLATDPDSYELLVELIHANEALKGEQPQEDEAPATGDRPEPQAAVVPLVPKAPRTRGWAIAGGVLAVAAALVLVVRLQPDLLQRLRGGDAVDPLMAKLVDAVGEERYIEARLTGGFKYGPLRSVTRGPGDLSQQNLALLAAAGELQRRASEGSTPEASAALAVALIQLGDLAAGIEKLETAKTTPQDSDALSNLAAAYLARSEVERRAADLALALDTVEKALAISPNLPEALFNRALILEKLGLTRVAVEAWRAFIRVDNGSAWSYEAGERLEVLSNRPSAMSLEDATKLVLANSTPPCELVDRDGLLMREVVEDSLLPKWADAYRLNDKAATNTLLMAASNLAECLDDKSAGALTLGAVNAILRSTPESKSELASAHQLWRVGRQGYATSDPTKFGPAFATAEIAFRRNGSPLHLWTRQYAIGVKFFEGNLDEALRLTDELEEDPQLVKGSVLWGRLQWNKASLCFQRADFSCSLAGYRSALEVFERAAERENIVAMHQSLAESYGRIGIEREAWEHHLLAIAGVRFLRDYRRVHAAVASPGFTADIAELHGAAYDFFREGRLRAIAAHELNFQFDAEAGMGRSLVARHQYAAAERVLRDALLLRERVQNPSMKARHTAEIYAGLAEVEAARANWSESLKWSDSALEAAGSVSSEYRVAAFHLQKGRIWHRSGRFEDARQSFETGVGLIESKRALLDQADQRVAYTDRVWDLYGDLVSLTALDLGDPMAALNWMERGRNRSTGLKDGRLVQLVAPESGLPADRGILAVSRTNRGVFVWLLTSTGVTFRHAADASEIDAFADPRLDPSARVLAATFDLLIRRFSPELQPIRRLTVVPDWNTQTIPFAALRDSSSAQPLVEQLDIDYSPSVSVALATAKRPRASTALRSVVVVSGAERDAVGYGVALPGAEREADEIAALYPASIRLRGATATLGALQSAMHRADVLHLAMHARADGRYLDRFTLDIIDQSTGAPMTADTSFAGGNGPQVVVLAACRTARGPLVRGEILMSLARPFMIAGSRTVVATMTDIPDQLTHKFMTSFHGGLTNGLEPNSAFSSAQRLMSRQFPEDTWWAAFVLVTLH